MSEYKIIKTLTHPRGTVVVMKAGKETIAFYDRNNNQVLDRGDKIASKKTYRNLLYSKCPRGFHQFFSSSTYTDSCLRVVTAKEVERFAWYVNTWFRQHWFSKRGRKGIQGPKGIDRYSFYDKNDNGMLDSGDYMLMRPKVYLRCPEGAGKAVEGEFEAACVRNVTDEDLNRFRWVGNLFIIARIDRLVQKAFISSKQFFYGGCVTWQKIKDDGFSPGDNRFKGQFVYPLSMHTKRLPKSRGYRVDERSLWRGKIDPRRCRVAWAYGSFGDASKIRYNVGLGRWEGWAIKGAATLYDAFGIKAKPNQFDVRYWIDGVISDHLEMNEDS